jgi:hypothetical protein
MTSWNSWTAVAIIRREAVLKTPCVKGGTHPFLSKDGRLPVFKVGGPAEKFMQQLATDFFAAGMLYNVPLYSDR